jgi:hypothetical protein
MSINWKNLIFKLSSINTDLVKQQQKRVPYKTKSGKDTPLQAEFTGDKFPTSGDSVKKELSAWKEQNAQFKKLDDKGNPSGGKSVNTFSEWRYIGSALMNDNAGRAETMDSHEELAQGAAPSYKTGTRFRVGAKFASRVTNNTAILKNVGAFSKFKDKVASKEYVYVGPFGESAPNNDNLVVVAYTRPGKNDGITLLTPLNNFVASFEYIADLKDFDEDDLEEDVESSDEDSDESKSFLENTELSEVPEGSIAYVMGDDGEPKFFTAEDIVQLINDFRAEKSGDMEEELEEKVDESKEKKESSQKKLSKSPPHSEYTVREMKKHRDKIDNPWALAWWMKNKHYKLHDTKPKESSWKSTLQSIAKSTTDLAAEGLDENHIRSVISQAGGYYIGASRFPNKTFLFFNDPMTESTLVVFPENLTVENVKKIIADSREKFGVTASKKEYYCNTCETSFSKAQMNFHKNHDYEKRDGKVEEEMDDEEHMDDEEQMTSKEASNIEFQKKPDGTINISLEEGASDASGDTVNGMNVQQPTQPTSPPQAQTQQPEPVKNKKAASDPNLTYEDGYRNGQLDKANGLEPLQIALNSPNKEYARGYYEGYNGISSTTSLKIGSVVKDAELGEGTIESIDGNTVIASFGGKKYKTTKANLI